MNGNDQAREQPYRSLGTRLRTMREKVCESAAEVSGAVEIDIDTLERIEHGSELPSEDILMLLINHFGIGDEEAVDLWELAGYDQSERLNAQNQTLDENRMTKQPVVLLALDSRVVYSNGIEIVNDNAGVVLSFTQYIDTKQGAVPVARVGMSYEQAEQVLSALQRTLLHSKYLSGPKSLPATSQPSKRTKKRSEKGNARD